MAQLRGERERARLRPPARGGLSVNYARRQQYRRLTHAGRAGLGSIIAALFGLVIASAGAPAFAGLLFLAAVGLGLYARHWLSLAGRSRVGAHSEDEVQRARPSPGRGVAASALAAVAWPGRHRLGGDRAHRHCCRDRDEDQNVRPPPSRSGAGAGGVVGAPPAPVVPARRRAGAVRRARPRVQRYEHDVLVVSIDRLELALRSATRMFPGCGPQG